MSDAQVAAPSAALRQPRKSNAELRPLEGAGEGPLTLTDALLEILAGLGVKQAFGLVGGAIAPLCDALGRSELRAIHCRHEGGAAFAATEAYFASGDPTMVFATTGPGITNAITGLCAARQEGAKVVLISGSTAAALRGRWATQETSLYTMPISGLFAPGKLFHYAVTVEHPSELEQVAARLASGFARPDGFVAHVSLSTALQSTKLPTVPRSPMVSAAPAGCDAAVAERCARMLAEKPFAIWVGFGARRAARAIRMLAERSGSAVMCSPRGKGIFPEDHPQFVGVTGLGGHSTVEAYMASHKPAHVLVLGTRLGEPTSFWNPALVPPQGFIHVDLDPEVFGAAYPAAKTHAVQAEIGAFLEALLQHFPERSAQVLLTGKPTARVTPISAGTGTVRAQVLLDTIQRVVVEKSDAVVMTESGNAFAWGNQLLRFQRPGRYRVSTGFGSMGHFTAGVVGAALARGGKAVALVGDGSMLMNSEVSTAVRYGAPAVWIVMNDARYGMVEHGMRAEGFTPLEAEIPRTDFTMIARGMGADGIRVDREADLEAALEVAMAAPGPFVLDVLTDPSEAGPWMKRIQNLIVQRAKSSKGGAQ